MKRELGRALSGTRRAMAGAALLTALLPTARAGAAGVESAGLSIRQVWSAGPFADSGNPIALSSPGLATLDGGGLAVVVGDRAGHVYAMHIADGSSVAGWPTSTGGVPVDSTPSSIGSTVYVGVGNAATPHSGGYEAFGADGFPIWFRSIAAQPGSSTPTAGVRASLAAGILQGTPAVVAGSMGQLEVAINAFNGSALPGWPFFQADSNFSTPALGDLYRNGSTEIVEGGDSTAGVAFGQVYSNGGHLRVMSSTGQLLSAYNTNQVVQSSPAIGQFLAGGAVGIVTGTGTDFAGASQTNQLLAFDPHCNVAWVRTLDGSTTSSPALVDALGNGALQVAEGTDNGTSGGVWLLNGTNGSVIWHEGTIGRVIGSVVSADLGGGHQDLLVPTTGGLEILDGRTGALLATPERGIVALQNSPVVTDDPNGTIGITIAGYNGANRGVVYHLEVDGTVGGRAAEPGSWPMFHHDLYLTGNAGITPPAPCKPPAARPRGYYMAASDGGIFEFGNLPFCGSTGDIALNRPVVGMAATSSGGGYWLVASDGGLFTFGNARFWGSTGNVRLNEPIVGMAPDRATGGYWLVARDGGIFPFHAPFLGSTGSVHLNQPIVGMAADPATGGYWLVAADGGIFDFNAPFLGSTGNVRLNQPIVGMASTPDGKGYWLVARDGGIFEFGDANFFGSTGNVHLNEPIVGMAPDRQTGGYWLVASDGGVFEFNAPFYGSTGNIRLNRPIVAMAGF